MSSKDVLVKSGLFLSIVYVTSGLPCTKRYMYDLVDLVIFPVNEVVGERKYEISIEVIISICADESTLYDRTGLVITGLNCILQSMYNLRLP